MRRIALIGLAGALALAGCGGGSGGDGSASGATTGSRTFSSPRFGVSLKYPASWHKVGAGLPAAMTFSDPDGSARCVLSLAPSAQLTARPQRLAAARRLSVPLSGGLGLRILCSSHRRDFAEADRRAFVPLIASVSIHRDPLVTRAQAAVARLDGVQSATVQRVQHRLDVSLRVTAEADPEAVARSAVAAVSEISPQDYLGVSAAPPDLRGYALVRWDGGTDRGTIQIGTNPPRPLTLGG